MSEPAYALPEWDETPPMATSALPPIVILNPASKRGAKLRRWLERELKTRGGELVSTSAPREATRYAQEAAQAGRGVVAVGGDGTIAEIAQGILRAGRQVPLGIVPAGNGNDYAYYTLNLPRDQGQALDVALNGTPRPMDVGQVNDTYFVNSLGVGIDANIAATAEKMKRTRILKGHALYYAASLTELVFHYSRCPHLTVTVDDQPHDPRYYAMAALNLGPTAGGGFKINPGADPHDGLLDVCLIWKPSQLRALKLLPMVEKGIHVDQPEVKRLRVQRIVLESQQTIYAHVDGEVTRARRFDARILPAALYVRQP